MDTRSNVLNSGGGRESKRVKILFPFIVVCLTVIVSIVKYRGNNVNYLNSDATWHTLLTIRAYEETPIKQHLFLPIVSLGAETDKGIPWGATVSDNQGNYYYTSFSPAGFFAPWLFIKIFRLNICEKSLYIFNTFLLSLSAVLWYVFICKIYKDNPNRYIISLIGAISYVLTPEILHGMGIVYWSQSIMQVTLIAQIMAFFEMKNNNSKTAKVWFYVLTLINPYIEWTGYVANAGFILYEFVDNDKGEGKKTFANIYKLGIITILSFVLFCFHYLQRIGYSAFFHALKSRFFARNITSSVELSNVFGGYYKSFLYIWVLLLVLLIWIVAVKKNISCQKYIVLFILTFPIIENVIMKQHALSYTYDRMKAGYILSFIVCDICEQIMCYYNNNKSISMMLVLCAISFGMLNLRSYMKNKTYTWETNYYWENKMIADYINRTYPNSILGLESYPVRGYINLLFARGIYEFSDIDYLIKKAEKNKMQYVVMIEVEKPESWNVYDLSGALIYDLINDDIRQISVLDGKVIEYPVQEIYLSDLTDNNWTNGINNTNQKLLLFPNTFLNYTKLVGREKIYCKGKEFEIINSDHDRLWIRVYVDKNAEICGCSNAISVE